METSTCVAVVVVFQIQWFWRHNIQLRLPIENLVNVLLSFLKVGQDQNVTFGIEKYTLRKILFVNHSWNGIKSTNLIKMIYKFM